MGGFFFLSRGKKKTVKSTSGEVGRRKYVITGKKKKPTPFALGEGTHRANLCVDAQIFPNPVSPVGGEVHFHDGI